MSDSLEAELREAARKTFAIAPKVIPDSLYWLAADELARLRTKNATLDTTKATLRADIVNLERERDRLHTENAELQAQLTRIRQAFALSSTDEERRLRTDNATLRDALKIVNDQAERFERESYLKGVEIDTLRELVREALPYIKTLRSGGMAGWCVDAEKAT